MSKYAPLADMLAGAATSRVLLKFPELDALIGGLPANARADRTWWGNTTNVTRVQARAWMGVGLHVDRVNLVSAEVIFARDSAATDSKEIHG